MPAVIKNSGTGTVLVDGNGNTIDGLASALLYQKDCITLVSDGTDWIIT